MRYSFILIALLLLLGAATSSYGEWNTPTYEQLLDDTLVSTENDTNTFIIQGTTDVLLFQFIPLANGTVSAKYRNFERAGSLHRGGTAEPVSFIKSDGTTTTSLVCTAGECYTLAIDPLGGGYHQLVITGSTTIPYTLICGQRDDQ